MFICCLSFFILLFLILFSTGVVIHFFSIPCTSTFRTFTLASLLPFSLALATQERRGWQRLGSDPKQKTYGRSVAFGGISPGRQLTLYCTYTKWGWRGLTRCRGGGLHPRSSDRSCKGCPNQTSARYTTKCRARAAPEAGPATSDRRPNPLAEKIADEDQIDPFVVNPAALRDGAWDSGLLAVETHVQEIDSAEI